MRGVMHVGCKGKMQVPAVTEREREGAVLSPTHRRALPT